MLNLEQLVEVKDADGSVIKNKENATPHLGELLLFALRQAHQSDINESETDCKKRGLLIKRMAAVKEIDLTEDEKKLCSARVHKFYLQVELKNAVWDILDGK